MNVLVTIPIDRYRILAEQCGADTAEFKLLKNSVIEEERVIIRCDETVAARLLDWARAVCPKAADSIAIAPDPTPPRSS